MIQPSLVPLLIVGSKYDIFQVSAREIWRGNKANTHTHSFSHSLTHTRTHARTHADFTASQRSFTASGSRV